MINRNDKWDRLNDEYEERIGICLDSGMTLDECERVAGRDLLKAPEIKDVLDTDTIFEVPQPLRRKVEEAEKNNSDWVFKNRKPSRDKAIKEDAF